LEKGSVCLGVLSEPTEERHCIQDCHYKSVSGFAFLWR